MQRIRVLICAFQVCNPSFYSTGIFSEPGPGVVVLEVVAVGWRPAEGWISNPYVLEVPSLIGDLLVAVSTPYLKIIVALVVPGAVAA